MEPYKFDSEIHALSKDYAYIMTKINVENFEDSTKLTDEQYNFAEKYIDYLIAYDKEKIRNILLKRVMPNINGCVVDEDCTFIYRPPCNADKSSKIGTLALKFKRAEKDNLKYDECDH